MIIKKLFIIIISYYISTFLVIDKKHYDIHHYHIEYFKEERFRCIRYIDMNRNKKRETMIIKYINNYPYAKCIKYKDEYIEYIINKNKIIIYNTLIHIILYIHIIFL
jgi:hypothetical protein|uniref:Uncharacterized protein n=1 Tax=viral metagenome TaxID=1070528 RepID=A0A6C0IAU1_9ZZZZ